LKFSQKSNPYTPFAFLLPFSIDVRRPVSPSRDFDMNFASESASWSRCFVFFYIFFSFWPSFWCGFFLSNIFCYYFYFILFHFINFILNKQKLLFPFLSRKGVYLPNYFKNRWAVFQIYFLFPYFLTFGYLFQLKRIWNKIV